MNIILLFNIWFITSAATRQTGGYVDTAYTIPCSDLRFCLLNYVITMILKGYIFYGTALALT